MKKNESISLIVFLLAAAMAHAQGTKPLASHKKTDFKEDWDFTNGFALKYTPTSLLDPYGALFPVGMEYYFGSKYGVSLDIGLPLYYVLNNHKYNYDKQVNSDIKLRADVRQYFHFRKNNRLFYGAELFYRNQQMDLRNSYFHFINDTCYNFSEAKAEKNDIGFGLILGISQKLSQHFFLEGNIGFGLRIINMSPQWDKHASAVYATQSFISLQLPNEDRVGDHDVNIYMPFAVKMVYMF